MLELQKIKAPLNQLGEGLLWDHNRQVLWWLDIEQHKIFKFDIKREELEEITTDKFIGALFLTNTTDLLVFADQKLFLFNPDDKQFRSLNNSCPIIHQETLPNDGKIDREGNLIFGTKHETCNKNLACAYFYDNKSQEHKKILENLTVFNGPAFDSKGFKIYFTDSPSQKIICSDYKNGMLSNKRTFAQTSENIFPDGMTVDSEDCLWNAEWNGFCVKRYSSDGKINMKIKVPVPLVTNICFGGENLNLLFITTAFTGLSEKERKEYPESGSLYFVELPNIKGLKEKEFSIS